MIAVFRHGETIYNIENKYQGWSNSPLTDRGIQQVNRTADDFKKKYQKNHTSLYSSSLQRSIDSAYIFQNIIPVDNYTQCDSLKERYYGEHEGSQISFPLSDLFGMRYNPNSESLADVYERVSRFLDFEHIRYDDPSRTIIFHVHHGVSKILRGIFLQLPPAVWLGFDHDQSAYYLINGRYCQEFSCE